MKWFRLYSSVLHDPKVQMLPPDVFKGWVNLLCLANESEPRGVLPDVATIAWGLRLSHDDVVTLLATLRATGLLDPCNDDEACLTPHNWSARQQESDDVAARVARWRSARKQATPSPIPSARPRNVTRNVTRNVAVTPSEERRGDKKREREAHAPVRVRARGNEAAADAAPVSLSLSSTPSASEPEPEGEPPAPTPVASEHPLHEACVVALGHGPTTGRMRRKWRDGLADLARLNVTPDDIPKLVRQYHAKFGDTIPCEPWNLADHYPKLGASPHVLSAANGATGKHQADHGSRPAYSPADAAAKRRTLAALGIAVPDFAGPTSDPPTTQ